MPAQHKATNYKPQNVKNPYLDGKGKAYGDILEKAQKKSQFLLYIITPCSLGLFAITLLLFFHAISLQATVPVLVNVMPTGEAAFLGEVRHTGEVAVPEAAIVFQVRTFITNMRSIPADAQVLYSNINQSYAMVTSAHEPHMTRHLRANSPFPLVGSVRRTVEKESIIRVTGNSYQADWTEVSVSQGGSPTRRRMRGLITIILIPPQPSFIRYNPLGIFIDAFEWTEL